MLQFGVKFFIGTAGAMVLVLALSAGIPSLRQWRLLYAYFTIVVVLSEKARRRTPMPSPIPCTSCVSVSVNGA